MHWYAQGGSPAHFQKDGKNTTLAHARKQALVPSVTGILDIVASPGLTTYFINQHLEAAWSTDPDEYEGDYTAWMKDVREIAGEHAKQARDKGTDIHNALENWYLGGTDTNPYVEAVTAALSNVYAIEVGNCTPERTFATEEYGGAADIVGDNIVIDIKTKASMWKTKKDGTPHKSLFMKKHCRQLAAYRVGLNMPNAKCANVFVGPNAEVYIHEWSEDELQKGYDAFMHLIEIWKDENEFY